MSRTRRFLDGVWLGYAYQGLLMLTGLWLTPFLLHRIGQHAYGVWLIALQVLAYLGLVDIGVVALLPREVAYATGRSGGTTNSPELPIIIGRTALVVMYQMPVVVIAALAVWFLVPVADEFRGFIGLILVIFLLLFPLRIFRATIEGLQDLKFAGRLQIVTWFSGTVTSVILILLGLGLYAVAIGWATTQILASGALAWRVWRHFPHVLPTRRSDFRAKGTWEYLKRGLWASMSQVAQPLLSGADILVIGKVLGAAAVVPYICTGKLVSVFANQPQMLLDAALPGLSEIKASQSKRDIFRVTTALSQASLLLSGAVACVVITVNHGFVSAWVGYRQFGGEGLSIALALCMVFRLWNITAIYTMFSYGLERRLSVMCLADGIVTLGASVFLIRWLGPIGGPLGSLFSVCTVSLPANLWAVAREAGVSLWNLLRPLWPWAWRFLTLAVSSTILVMLWVPTGLLHTALAGLVSALAYVAVMLSIGEKSVLWPYIRPRVSPIWNGFNARFDYRSRYAPITSEDDATHSL